MLSSMASQTRVAAHADSVGREPKSEVTRRGGDADSGGFDCLQEQASSSSSQQEQSDSSKVRRVMGLQTWALCRRREAAWRLRQRAGGQAVRSNTTTVARGRRGAGGASAG